MRRTLALLVVATSIVACAGTPSDPAVQSDQVPTPALTPVPGLLPTPTPAATGSVPTPKPGDTSADADVRLEWTLVTEPDIRPKRGFEHAFLDSDLGVLILVRHLVGDPTTIVATTRNGVDWTTAELPSDGIPAGREVNGGPEWMQVVEQGDGRLELVASADGLTWQSRGTLPQAIATPWASAVNGASILVCGAGRAPREGLTTCASSSDGGATWMELAGLAAMTGLSAAGAAPLGDTLVVAVGGPGEFEATSFTEADGVTWQRQLERIPNAATGLTAFDGMVFAVGRAAEGESVTVSIAVSSDGITWEPVALPQHDGYVDGLVDAGRALVAPATWNVPEGPTELRDVLLSTDGRSWRSAGLPAELRDWADPTFLPVENGILVMGNQRGQLVLGTVVPAAGAS